MTKDKSTCDFSGFATVYGVKCTDNRTILKDAFKHNDGAIVPLVWQHVHSDPTNVLGHGLLENRQNGVYLYGWFNNTPGGQAVKESVAHGDIDSISIYANKLVEKSGFVEHGTIREASLVLSGANPGAKIDYSSVMHSDGSTTDLEDEGVIYTDSKIELPVVKHDSIVEHADSETLADIFNAMSEEKKKVAHALIAIALNVGDESTVAQSDNSGQSLSHEGSGKTVQQVFDTFTEKEKNVLYAIIGQAKEALDAPDSISQSETTETTGDVVMEHKNVFDQTPEKESKNSLTHDQFAQVMDYAAKAGSLKEAFLAHAVTYGIDNIDYLFPDAKTLTNEPTFVQRNMGWVSTLMSNTDHRPFSRIKTITADITLDTARALGYVKGALKKEEFFALTRRTTTPTTIYKKQKLDRDDVLDITDVNVVAWMKKEMRMMLDEEVARAVLIGDGRAVESGDKVDETHIRPIYKDADFYSHRIEVASTADTEDTIDALIRSRQYYKGSGSPTMFTSSDFLTDMLMIKDTTGRRIYKTEDELKAVLRVSSIVEVPVMTGVSRETTETTPRTLNLVAIIVNPRDYAIGADNGAALGMFEDFDLNYNQMLYLLETRISGALTLPKSAIIIEKVDAG